MLEKGTFDTGTYTTVEHTDSQKKTYIIPLKILLKKTLQTLMSYYSIDSK